MTACFRRSMEQERFPINAARIERRAKGVMRRRLLNDLTAMNALQRKALAENQRPPFVSKQGAWIIG